MPMMSACRSCSRPVLAGTAYCGRPECQANVRDANAHWSPWRDRRTQDAFRKRLRAEFGDQCAAVENGVRCPVSDPRLLDAHHGKNGEPDALLCSDHHQKVDSAARPRSR